MKLKRRPLYIANLKDNFYFYFCGRRPCPCRPALYRNKIRRSPKASNLIRLIVNEY
jgi:hypothetical protein